MPDRDPNVRQAIEHSIRVLGHWTLALYIVVALVLGYGILANRATTNAVEEASNRTDKALCTFVADLERRVESSQEFLDRHPGGIPGISGLEIRRSIENQKRTLKALSGLNCPDV